MMEAAVDAAVSEKRETRRTFMRYVILTREKGRLRAEFRSSEKAMPSAVIGVDEEFREFLDSLFEKVNPEEADRKVEAVYRTDKDIFFEISMIYAYIMRVLRKEERPKLRRKITENLFRLHPYELIFWNHHFSRSRDRYTQDRVARAFLMLYNLR